MDLSSWIKHEARALGFSLVGMTTAEPFPEAEARTVAWLDEGRQGEMAWLSAARTHAAARPTELLPGARSIVALGVSYRQPSVSPEQARQRHGRFARYAL